jgi:hypothetical protein
MSTNTTQLLAEIPLFSSDEVLGCIPEKVLKVLL